MNLLNLPLEILHQVLQHLGDLKSLVAARETCGAIKSLSDDRNLWYPFIARFDSRPGSTRLGKSWKEYSGEELSQWIVTRYLVNEFWQTPPGPAMSHRTSKRGFEIERMFHNKETILLPGGRWLLVLNNDTGRVISLDLDSMQPKVEEVISPHRHYVDERMSSKPGVRPWFRWKHWVDYSQQHLSIRLAISSSPKFIHEQCTGVCQIYNLEYSGQGSHKNVRARKVNSFHRHITDQLQCVGLDDEYLVEIQSWTTMKVFRYWAPENGQPIASKSLRPMTVEITPPRGRSYFWMIHVWNGQVIILSENTVDIYTLSQIHALGQPQGGGVNQIGPLHQCSFQRLGHQLLDDSNIFAFRVSEPVTLPDSVRFTFALGSDTVKWIMGVSVPYHTNGSPRVIPLARLPSDMNLEIMKMGWNYTLLSDDFNPPATYGLCHENWENASGNLEVTLHLVCDSLHPAIQNTSEKVLDYAAEIGRMVTCTGYNHFGVVDLV